MATKSKSRKRKRSLKVEEEFQSRVKLSTRIGAVVAVLVILALIGGMIALGSAGTF